MNPPEFAKEKNLTAVPVDGSVKAVVAEAVVVEMVSLYLPVAARVDIFVIATLIALVNDEVTHLPITYFGFDGEKNAKVEFDYVPEHFYYSI